VTGALRRISVVDELTAVLRDRILDGDLAPGTPLREADLAQGYAVSRHTLRAALRELSVEGLVRIEPNRGASVARLDEADIHGLYELRAALELEAAHLALERHDGRLPAEVVAAVAALTAACRSDRPSWHAVAAAHATVHGAIVSAAGSSRIEASYATLARELQLFLVQLQPVWSLERMVAHHEALIVELEQEGPPALRRHLQDGADAVLGAAPRP
jgi:DNA-binding GntR family transcriptional regulator